MAAISFDQPSGGQVTSDKDALNVVNNGVGRAVWGQSNGGEGVHGETNSERETRDYINLCAGYQMSRKHTELQ